MIQLTKKELQEIELKSEISELQFDIITNYTVIKKTASQNQVKLKLISTEGKLKELTVGGNFNKEGDRRFHSKDGDLIVKYFTNDC